MNLKTLRSNLLLTLTALIWGSAFVAQSVGMDFIGPFTFNSVRSFIGALALVPVIFLFNLSFFQIGPLPEPYPVQAISYSVS